MTDAAKFLRRRVEQKQRPLGDAEIGAVQVQGAAVDQRPHERESHEVFQAAKDRGLLDADGEVQHRFAVALLHHFAGLKQKLLASIVAISAIQVLKAFMNIDAAFDPMKLRWLVAVHLVFVVSTLVLALSDRWGGDHGGGSDHGSGDKAY